MLGKFRKLIPHLVSHIGLNVLIQLINLLTSIIIISLLPFSQMGLYAITMVAAGSFGLLSTLRMEWIVLNTRGNREAKLAASCGLSTAFIFAPIALLMMIAFQQFEFLNFEKTDTTLLFLAALFSFTFASQRMLITHHLSQTTIRENLNARLFHATVRLIASSAICFGYPFAPAIFMAEIIATLLVVILLGNWREFSNLTDKFLLKFKWVFKRHRKIFLFATPSAVLNSLATTVVPTIIISVSGLDAGGLIYTVQRVAGVPVKFALTTIGEAWHKLVQSKNRIAIKIAQNPKLIAIGMIVIWISMYLGISLTVYLLPWIIEVQQNGKIDQTLRGISSYKIYIATTLAVNIFNRILIIREAIHKKIVFDVLLLILPTSLFYLVPTFEWDTYNAIFVLAVLQFVAYLYLAGLILYEAKKWHILSKMNSQ